MAELNFTSSSARRGSSLKSLPRVDLTAMVDLAFLLITFFMLTTAFASQKAMPVIVPAESPSPMPVAPDRTMTVCLGANNQLLWYMGMETDDRSVRITSMSGLRTALQTQMERVKKVTGRHLILLVKPSDKSNFKNLVDILDELAIVEAPVYAIVDITAAEEDILRRKRIY